MAVIGWALPMSTTGPKRAQVALKDIDSGKNRTVAATIKLDPRDSATNPDFMNVTAWQGGSKRVLDPLEQVGQGVYRTTKPIPVYGGWKATMRIQQGDALISMPLFMPKDQAIPVPEVPAKANFTRGFLEDKKVLQREQKQGVPGFLTLAAYLTVLAIALSLIALLAWALLRVDRGEARSPRAGRSRRPRAELCETALKGRRQPPKHLVASSPRRVRGNAERGNQGGCRLTTGANLREGAQALSARARS